MFKKDKTNLMVFGGLAIWMFVVTIDNALRWHLGMTFLSGLFCVMNYKMAESYFHAANQLPLIGRFFK